jgi:3-oxoacyl-[acyl-carrier protein] reductase
VTATVIGGRTVVVTGGSRGWGRAIVRRYAAPGTTIVLGYASSRAHADISAAQATDLGAEVLLVRGDISDSGVVNEIRDAVAAGAPLTALIHNAFYRHSATPLNLTDEDFDRAMDIGPKALLNLVRACLPFFPPSGGHIVCTGSSGTQRLYSRSGSTYFPMAAAKGALEVTIRYLAADLGPRHVTVNGVAAGFIENEGASEGGESTFHERIRAKTPLGGLVPPDHLAEVVHFLGSPGGSWVTGQIVLADGGFSLI